MRRYTFLFCLIWSIPFSVSAQNIPNPSFDSIYFGGIDRVFDWITSDGFVLASGSNADTIQPLSPNTRFDARGFQFSELLFTVSAQAPSMGTGASIRLLSQPEKFKLSGAPFETFITNGHHVVTDMEGYLDFSKGGTPFPFRPIALNGQYQFVDTVSAIDNFGKCIVLLKKFNVNSGTNDTIAYIENTLELNPTSGWQNFSIPINYRSGATPDSIVVIFFANTNPTENTELWLDKLNFDFTTNIHEVLVQDIAPVLYPNPNTGILRIDPKGKEFTTFRLLDLQGKVLREGAFETSIQVPKVSEHVLLLQLINAENQMRTYKVICK